MLVDGKDATLLLVGSPFNGAVVALDPKTGAVLWRKVLTERISRPGRMLADVALLASHTGSLLALDIADGDERWKQPSEKPQDFAAISPIYIEGNIYTLTESGMLSRYSVTGERLTSRQIDTNWANQQAEFVPMWRDNTGLSFLDQAGRLRSFDLATLATISDKKVITAVGPGMGQLGSEVLGGVYSAALGWIWTTELSGLLRSSLVENGRTRWTAYIGTPDQMYSRDGRVLAVPILSLPPDQKALVVTLNQAWIFSADSGRVLHALDLPSPAVAPPLFDINRQTWWIVTEDYLCALDWGGQMILSEKLPVVDRPYAAALAGNLLVIGTEAGTIYAMPIPAVSTAPTGPLVPVPPIESAPLMPAAPPLSPVP